MLVLTRKLAERLYIGQDICVTVVRIEGGQVRLGIEAPRSVPVVRSELLKTPEAESTEDAPRHIPHPKHPEFRESPAAPLGTGIRRRAPSR